MAKVIKSGMLYRTFDLDRASVDTEKRTVRVSFSSEEPVQRGFGKEILDHNPRSVRMDRLRKAGPALFNHDRDAHIGRVVEANINGGRGDAVIQFSNSALGSEKFRDVQEGILNCTSVGYRVWKMEETKGASGDVSFRCVDWEPMEISLVTTPADVSVGVGREAQVENEIQILNRMSEENKSVTPAPAAPVAPAAPTFDKAELGREAVKTERLRVGEIRAHAENLAARIPSIKDIAARAEAEGWDLNQFKSAAIEAIPAAQAVRTDKLVGMSDKEAKSFSFVRAIRALANPTDRKAQEDAAFEFEASEAAQQKRGTASKGIAVPLDVLTRDQTVGTAADGGNLVATNLLSGSFIELLRKRLVVRQAGALVLPGLVGSVAIPRQTAGTTAYWVAESGSPTEGAATFDQVTMAPKTVGAFVDMSRKTMLQTTPGIEMLIRNDLNKIIALEIDRAALHGSGSSNQPTGVAAQSGIGSVAGGTNGLAPAWSHIVGLESAIANSNADGNTCAYITNSRVRGKLKQTLKNGSGTDASFIWQDGGIDGDLPYGMVNGYKALVTNQVSNTLTKGTASGVCSAIFFGDWSQLVIGEWGALDLLADPYTGGTAGTLRVRVLQDVDVAVRQPTAFAAMLDALTT